MFALASIFILLLSLLAKVAYHPTSSAAELILGKDETARVLLLTAHPDDECLFFAPTVSSLLAQPSAPDASGRTVELYSLCLSTGDADGLGEVRAGELARSLDILGIPEGRRWLIDHP